MICGRYLLLLFTCSLFAVSAGSHPMPNSVLLLDVRSDGADAELQWPLKELQLAFPNEDIDAGSQTLLQRKGPWLEGYLRRHLKVVDAKGRAWTYSIQSKEITGAAQDGTGQFKELKFQLLLQAPAGSSPRKFTVYYDAIMHQVVTHKMYVAIRQDWDGGLTVKDSADAELGILMMNPGDNKVPPLIVTLDEGSKWKGFRSMVSLGMEHIADGTDHLLFLLVLLLPAPLIAVSGRWTVNGGTRYSLIRLLKITTAFTIGHSLTLLLGAIGWVHLPSQPIEVLIAVSILIGAVHALKPIFPGKEAFVAAGFGLVHGLAFAGTLANLHLDSVRMALSILGFNVGIELMQLFVILITVPWLIILSSYSIYRWVRIGGGILTAIAALAWITERVTSKPNAVSKQLEVLMKHANVLILALALMAIACYIILGKTIRSMSGLSYPEAIKRQGKGLDITRDQN